MMEGGGSAGGRKHQGASSSNVVAEQLLMTLSVAMPFETVLAGQETQPADAADDPFRYCPYGHDAHLMEPGASV